MKGISMAGKQPIFACDGFRSDSKVTRRGLLKGVAGTAAATAAALGSAPVKSAEKKPLVKNGRLNQSIAYWCFEKYWSMEKTCEIAQQLGFRSEGYVRKRRHFCKEYLVNKIKEDPDYQAIFND